jgi:hypothetical protein
MIDPLPAVTEMMTLPQMTQMTLKRKIDDDNVRSVTCPFLLGGSTFTRTVHPSSFILHPSSFPCSDDSDDSKDDGNYREIRQNDSNDSNDSRIDLVDMEDLGYASRSRPCRCHRCPGRHRRSALQRPVAKRARQATVSPLNGNMSDRDW